MPARAVLLLHGFGDTPQTLAWTAAQLRRRGFSVRVPLLPGHGSTIEDFDRASYVDWIDSARAELAAMRARHSWVALGGLSMGGAIATILAAGVRDLPALVLLAPYLSMPLSLRLAAMTADRWSDRIGPLRAGSVRSVHDPQARARSRGYGVVTGRALRQLLFVVREARNALPLVTAPTLIVQSREDNRIKPRVARRAIRRLGAERRRLVFTEGAGHVITVDYGREHVLEEICAWLGSGPGATPQPGRTERGNAPE